MNDSFEVALTKSACPICRKEFDDQLVMNTMLNPTQAKKIKDLHGKVISFHICSECQKIVDEGAVFLVEVDPDKCTPDQNNGLLPQNAYYTGRYATITKEAFERIFCRPSVSFAWINPAASNELGLFDESPS